IKEAGGVVEFKLEVTRGEIAALTRQAGILFQKAIPSNELASRVCIVEAMAAGCYVLAPVESPAAACVDGVGFRYRSVREAARKIAETAKWSDADWDRMVKSSAEKAYREFADTVVYRPVLDRWLTMLGRNPDDAFDAPERDATSSLTA
ncbi:MAG: hypothetical protein AAF942_15010, partial [Pseudomonadota bacterium]